VDFHSTGEKSGKRRGKMLFIVVKNVEKIKEY